MFADPYILSVLVGAGIAALFLATNVICRIVEYYSQIKAITALAGDMRSARLQEVSTGRSVLMDRGYLEMCKQMFVCGQHALKVASAYSGKGAVTAENLMQRVTTPNAGQRDLLQGLA